MGVASISLKAEQLIEDLSKNGFGGMYFPEIKKECPDDWSEDYAILQNVYWEVPFGEGGYDSPYFDWAQLEYDFSQYLKKFFDADLLIRPHEIGKIDYKSIPVGTLVVHYNDCSQEIEIYRKPEYIK